MFSLRLPQKVVLVGDTNVGKSTLIQQLTTNTFKADWKRSTTCCSTQWDANLPGCTEKLQIWDTPGDPMFNYLLSSACRNIEGAFLVYDVTVRQTFDHVRDWYNYITANSPPQATVMLVGTRTDKGREVSTEDGRDLATDLGATFMEVSATNAEQVTMLFAEMARMIVARGARGEEYNRLSPSA